MIRSSVDKSGVLWKERHPLLSDIRRKPVLYLMVLPAIIGFILFRYLPAYNMVAAFQNFNLLDGIWGSRWVGLKWFMKFFRDPFAFRLVKNTFLIAFYGLLWGFWAALGLAIRPPLCFSHLTFEPQHLSFLASFNHSRRCEIL